VTTKLRRCWQFGFGNDGGLGPKKVSLKRRRRFGFGNDGGLGGEGFGSGEGFAQKMPAVWVR
jgi:hypothetical protein